MMSAMPGGGARAHEKEEDIHPLPAPLASLPLVSELKGTILVSSLRGLRDGGHIDAYLAKLAPKDAEAIRLVVVGDWAPISLALAHYRACDALDLPPPEIVRMGAATARRMNSNFFAMVAKIAKSSGATPWTGLAQLQRVFEGHCRGGATRVVKLGPKEARVEFVAFPLMAIPWCRYGWRGTLAANAELFCEQCYAAEVGWTPTSVAYRLSWV
jgi:hypothetical protein